MRIYGLYRTTALLSAIKRIANNVWRVGAFKSYGFSVIEVIIYVNRDILGTGRTIIVIAGVIRCIVIAAAFG